MAHQVFISYSTADKLIADAICAKLESEKIRAWIAPRDILPGKDWEESLTYAIRNARAMVLVFSSSANLSSDVKRELDIAGRAGIFIIPFRIENVEPSGAFEYRLGNLHWLDAISPPMDTHLNRLVLSVNSFLNGTQPGPPKPQVDPAPPPPPPPPVPAPAKKSPILRNSLLGAGGLAAAIVVAVSMSHSTPKPVDPGPPVVPVEQPKTDPVVTKRDEQPAPAPAPIRAQAPAREAESRPAGLSAIYGDWNGVYTCPQQGTNQVAIRIYQVAPGHADAMVYFSVMQRGMPAPISGTYRTHVTYEPADESIGMRPEQWVSRQPMGFVASPFTGAVNLASGVIQGQMACGPFRVVRQGSRR